MKTTGQDRGAEELRKTRRTKESNRTLEWGRGGRKVREKVRDGRGGMTDRDEDREEGPTRKEQNRQQ